MNATAAIRATIEAGSMVSLAYLGDLTEAEMFHRAAPGINHVNWQVGHLIASENYFNNKVRPGAAPPLPANFAEQYSKESSTSDDPSRFCTKAELMKVYEEQRAATLTLLEQMTPDDFDKPSGVEYAPRIADLFILHGTHWLMHAGQWAVARRQLNRPPLF